MNLIWLHGDWWLPILYPVGYVLLMLAWFGVLLRSHQIPGPPKKVDMNSFGHS